MKNNNFTTEYKWKRVYVEGGQEHDNYGREVLVFCPFCNHEAFFNTDYGFYVYFDFCPYCGKKMRKK